MLFIEFCKTKAEGNVLRCVQHMQSWNGSAAVLIAKETNIDKLHQYPDKKMLTGFNTPLPSTVPLQQFIVK